jgi:hypothetical protein
MAARTGNFGFATACVFTRLAAELVAGVASARNVRALLHIGLCHRVSSVSRARVRRDTLVAEIRLRVASNQIGRCEGELAESAGVGQFL